MKDATPGGAKSSCILMFVLQDGKKVLNFDTKLSSNEGWYSVASVLVFEIEIRRQTYSEILI